MMSFSPLRLSLFGDILPAVRNGDGHSRLPRPLPASFHLFDHVLSAQHLSKHHVPPIEPRRGHRGDKELRSIAVGPRVGHRQIKRRHVLQFEILVLKVGPINAQTASAIVLRKVPSLTHEVGDDAVESAAFESKDVTKNSNVIKSSIL